MGAGERRQVDAMQRLDRFEGFLQADPGNTRLLADAFQAALQAGEWERASALLKRGQSAAPADPAWVLREGDLLLAQHRYGEARPLLEGLLLGTEAGSALAAVATHNLAFAEFSDGACASAIARLEPWVTQAPAAAGAVAPAMQQLWLRALHRGRMTARACEWASAQERAGQLAPEAAGVAALAAIDNSDLTAALRWAGQSMASAEPPTMEALVALSTLALAHKDVDAARGFADRALGLNPADGRALSARGFAELLAGAFDQAVRQFRQAVTAMPTHIGTWHGFGWSQMLSGDLAGARASFESALALDRNFAESQGAMAVILAMQKQVQAAQEHIERAQRLDRTNLSSRYAQAILSGEAQDSQAVQRLAHRLLAAREGVFGGTMADWLPRQDKPQNSAE